MSGQDTIEKDCMSEILADPNTPDEINEFTASCYNFICDDGTCSYEPLDTCGKVCDDEAIQQCQQKTLQSNCTEFLGCEEIKSGDGIWRPLCQYGWGSEYRMKKQQENLCFEIICESNKWIHKKRQGVEEWESHTNGCFTYQCNNETGRLVVVCSDGFVCINDECTESKVLKEDEKQTRVEIEMNHRVQVHELNTTEEIERIQTETGVSSDQLKLKLDVDEQGFVVRVIVYVDNFETAHLISKAVEKCNDNETENDD